MDYIVLYHTESGRTNYKIKLEFIQNVGTLPNCFITCTEFEKFNLTNHWEEMWFGLLHNIRIVLYHTEQIIKIYTIKTKT